VDAEKSNFRRYLSLLDRFMAARGKIRWMSSDPRYPGLVPEENRFLLKDDFVRLSYSRTEDKRLVWSFASKGKWLNGYYRRTNRRMPRGWIRIIAPEYEHIRTYRTSSHEEAASLQRPLRRLSEIESPACSGKHMAPAP